MPFTYDYPRPAFAADCALFAPRSGELQVLLIRRDDPPFEGQWATPGGFVEIDETADAAVRRELAEETGLEADEDPVELQRFDIFDAPDRDPRGRNITAAYWGLASADRLAPEADSDARAVGWFPVDDLPPLGFDHGELVPRALAALRRRARCGPIGRAVFPETFTFDALAALYETVLDRDVDRAALRTLLSDRGVIEWLEDDRQDRTSGTFRLDAYRRMVTTPPSPFVD
jgi:8-oxo-dGTP diphosphatase